MPEQPAPHMAEIVAADEDRILPGAIYVLYLVGLANGLTILLGLILAYLMRGTAGPVAASHYTFQIRTVWMSIAWFVIGLLLFLFGLPLSLVLVGIPAVMLGVFIMGAVGLWFAVRSVVGLVYLGKGEAYPRPNTWLV